MERAPAFFVWVLPILWGACSLAQSKFPGDENGFYVLSWIPAAWIAPFILLGRGSKEAIPVFVVLAGTPVMVGIGWVMDCLRIRKVLWAGLDLAGGLAVLFLTLSSYPSIERAVSTNGSLWAYVLLASNLGLYASVGLSVILTCIARGVRWSTALSKEAWRAIKEPDRHEHL